MRGRLLPAGARSVLVELDGGAEDGATEDGATEDGAPTALFLAARAAVAAGRLPAEDVVPGARSVLVVGRPGVDLGRLRDVVRRLVEGVEAGGRSVPEAEATVVTVPTRYDGEDLAEVARRWGMGVQDAVALHTATEFTVAFCGFAPGFAYCTGLPASLGVARLPRPRPRVPAGSVAVAGTMTGVYPREMPGGWLLLGRTDLPLWDLAADPPATLSPGMRVRFVEVGP